MTELVNPSLLSGFMELLPKEQVVFDRMKAVVEENFESFGFWPLDTPVIEKSEVLFSKGGGETTKQIYRIDKGESSKEQALRFDLTVPLARYVALHANELAFPFRRYQIGKVYRGERTQRGRFREFYQCDIDIIGHGSLSIDNDAEIPAVIYRIFEEMGLSNVTFHINNRKLLNGYMKKIGIDNAEPVLRSVDKLAKMGEEKVRAEIEAEGVSSETIDTLFTFLQPHASNEETLEALKASLHTEENASDSDRNEGSNDSETNVSDYAIGVEELAHVYQQMQAFGIPKENILIDLSITRGLDYYTGTVFETFLNGHESIGSIASGGRYDELASNFTKEHLPGIGLSIGLTRLFDQLRAADLLPFSEESFIRALVIPMGENERAFAIDLVTTLRKAGIVSQIYLEGGKMKKKFSYADKIDAKYALLIGEEEMQSNQVAVKNLETGEQELIPVGEIVDYVRNK